MVALVAPILVYIFPPESGNRRGDLKVKLDKALAELKEGEAVKFSAPPQTGFVMRDGGGANKPGAIAFSGYAVKTGGDKPLVFAVNCPHLGCSVAINTDAKRFDCPCHGSQFSLEGSVKHGPAAAPLSHLDWKPGADPQEILVSGIQLPGVGG